MKVMWDKPNIQDKPLAEKGTTPQQIHEYYKTQISKGAKLIACINSFDEIAYVDVTNVDVFCSVYPTSNQVYATYYKNKEDE